MPCVCLVAQSYLTLCVLTDCRLPGFSVHGDSPGKNTGVPCNTCLPCPPLRDLPNPGIEPRSPAWRTNSLLTEPPGKPKNTGVSSLSLLQEIFPTQESKQGLLHCKWILMPPHFLLSPAPGTRYSFLLLRVLSILDSPYK